MWGLLFLALLLLGCTRTKQDENWSVTGTFQVPATTADGTRFAYTMRGVEGQYGFIDADFVAGEKQKYMWHFWGKAEDSAGKTLVVKASNKAGKTVDVLSGTLAGPNNGAVAHMPSTMSLPAPGLWRLDIYVGGQLRGHIVVDVKPGH
jgi:hypothetical protein